MKKQKNLWEYESAWEWMLNVSGSKNVKKKQTELDLKYKKYCINYLGELLVYLFTTNRFYTCRCWNLCVSMASNCEVVPNQVISTSNRQPVKVLRNIVNTPWYTKHISSGISRIEPKIKLQMNHAHGTGGRYHCSPKTVVPNYLKRD